MPLSATLCLEKGDLKASRNLTEAVDFSRGCVGNYVEESEECRRSPCPPDSWASPFSFELTPEKA